MHNFIPKIFYFIDNFNKKDLNKLNKKIGIIYRNYSNIQNINPIKKAQLFCKNTKRKFYLSNNIKLAIKLNTDGVYIPAFNKDLNIRKNNMSKKKFLLGSAHNLKEIRIKEKQGVDCIFLSPIFKTKKSKKFLDIYKFNNLAKLSLVKIIALGGININNISKLKLLNCYGFASISFIKKNKNQSKNITKLN